MAGVADEKETTSTPKEPIQKKVVEVRDSRTGYLIPARDGPGALPDLESSWDVAAAAVSWKMPKYEEMHTFPKWACLKFPEM